VLSLRRFSEARRLSEWSVTRHAVERSKGTKLKVERGGPRCAGYRLRSTRRPSPQGGDSYSRRTFGDMKVKKDSTRTRTSQHTASGSQVHSSLSGNPHCAEVAMHSASLAPVMDRPRRLRCPSSIQDYSLSAQLCFNPAAVRSRRSIL